MHCLGSIDNTVDGSEIPSHHRLDGAKTLVKNGISTTNLPQLAGFPLTINSKGGKNDWAGLVGHLPTRGSPIASLPHHTASAS